MVDVDPKVEKILNFLSSTNPNPCSCLVSGAAKHSGPACVQTQPERCRD